MEASCSVLYNVCKSNVYCCNIFREEKICGSLLRQNNKVHAGSSVQFSSVIFIVA